MNNWDERYSDAAFVYGKEPNDFLVSSLIFLPPAGKILCLAEGEGRNSVFLAEQGYDMYGVDSSYIGLQKCKQFASERNVSVHTAVVNLNNFEPPENRFDAIVSIFCHLAPISRQQLHGKIHNSLTNNGVFILEGYNPNQLQYKTGGPKTPDLLMSLDALKVELSDLRIIYSYEGTREIHEGKLHTGLGAVVQLIAIKGE